MRILFLIVSTSLMLCCQRKSFIGHYTTAYDPSKIYFAGHSFEFLNDSIVDVVFWTDMVPGGKTGQGRYSIDKNQMVITFDTRQETFPETSIIPFQDSSPRHLMVHTWNTQGDTLQFVTVELLDENETMIEGGVTDKFGGLHFYISDNRMYNLRMSYIGYETLTIPIPTDASYHVDAVLGFSKNLFYQSHDTLKYTYAAFGRTLTLKNENTSLTLRKVKDK